MRLHARHDARLLGLRIFQATGRNIEDLGEEQGHRVLRVRGKEREVNDVGLLLARAEAARGVTLMPISGLPRVSPGHELPEDLLAFYQVPGAGGNGVRVYGRSELVERLLEAGVASWTAEDFQSYGEAYDEADS
jgi:hypothetical protein